jgi:hypothetical protein
MQEAARSAGPWPVRQPVFLRLFYFGRRAIDYPKKENQMELNTSRESKIDDLQTSYDILMSKTQSLCEVLRTYFKGKIGDNEETDIPATTIVSFLYQVDDNLERMEELVL